MSLTRFDHVGFTVADLDRSVAWYTRFLGSEPLLHQKGWDAEYTGTELIEYVSPAPGAVDMETTNVGNGHFCIVVDDLHAEYERLRGFAEFRSPEPVRIPQGPNEGAYGAYVRDPDGISIQLMQPPPGR